MQFNGAFIAVAIDYYSRLAMAEQLTEKTAAEIIRFIKSKIQQNGKPKSSITDNRKELCAKQ